MRTWTTCPCPLALFLQRSQIRDTPIDTLEGHPSNTSAASEGRVSEIRAKTSFRIASVPRPLPFSPPDFRLSVFQANSICSSLPQDFLRSDGRSDSSSADHHHAAIDAQHPMEGRSADPKFAPSLPSIHLLISSFRTKTTWESPLRSLLIHPH